jgi:hypothetical protein
MHGIPDQDGVISGHVRGNGSQKWMITVSMLNKDSRTAENGRSCSFRIERGANIPSAFTNNVTQIHEFSEYGRDFGLSNRKSK